MVWYPGKLFGQAFGQVTVQQGSLFSLYDLQTNLIEHKFPNEHTNLIENRVSDAGDIYREMTEMYPDLNYIMEKAERLKKWTSLTGGFRGGPYLTEGDWEEIKEEITDPFYRVSRNQYMTNLQRLRDETAKTVEYGTRKDVMLASLDMIQSLITWFESMNPKASPQHSLTHLTYAIGNHFPQYKFLLAELLT